MIDKIINFSPMAKRVVENIKNGVNQSVFSANIGEKAIFLLQAKKAIFVCESLNEGLELESVLNSFNKKTKLVSSSTELPIFTLTNQNDSELICAICDYMLDKIDYLLVLPQVLLQRIPSKEIIQSHLLNFEVGKNIAFNKLAKTLVESGYERVEIVAKKGDFAIRGDIVDIFSVNYEQPIRINFFDDEIEEIYEFILDGMKPDTKHKEVCIYPTSHILYDNSENIKKQLSESSKNAKISPDTLIKQQTILGQVFDCLDRHQYNLPFLVPCYDFADNILSLFPQSNFFIDEPKKVLESIKFNYLSNQTSTLSLIESGDLLPIHKNFLLEIEDVFKVNFASKTAFQNINSNTKVFDIKDTINLSTLPIRKYTFDFVSLVKDIRMLTNSGTKVILSCGNSINQKIVCGLFDREQIVYNTTLDNMDFPVFVLDNNFSPSASFLDGKIIVIGSANLFKKTEKVKTSLLNKKAVFNLPKVGDYVVHSIHGIGLCSAVEKKTLAGVERDYFVLEYKNGDKLFVPAEQANLLSLYMGSDKPNVNLLGGTEFLKLKERVKASVKKLAIDLIDLYSKREKMKGYAFSEDNYLMQKFEEDFEFDETADQLTAIKDVKKDMESKKIMDRLICGDVGYGKTEVALRACYKAIIDGKQVAFLCPTSILSQQHYETAKKRFKDFMVNVEVLNRLKTKKQQEDIVDRVKNGKVDLVIGTHRLLSKDIQFKNLGLLVLDEEQRFGVGDKEKIKDMKKEIDVLTLSATPIPRTLHFSLSGIRDISIIETPPKERIPVQTYVTEYSEPLLVDVCKREINRGGQVLIVYNRVQSIVSFKEKVQSLLPDINIGVAHGQMPTNVLENAINDLYNGKYQIMIATTILENGIDLPNANTIFVVDADKLGLSELYQLRGRVGRSNKVAYGYFTFDGNKVLTEDAYKRLSAITEYTELGSGFKLAMRDLEIRGAGNLLGKEQHGHIEKVGYDMFSKLLAEAVGEIKGEKKQEKLPIKMDVQITAYLPDDYVKQEEERIRIYTNISEIENQEQVDTMINSLKENFGEVPKELLCLIKIAYLKNLAEKYDVKRVMITKNECELYLYKKQEIISEQLADKIAKNKNICVLKLKELPILEFENSNFPILDKIEQVINFLK